MLLNAALSILFIALFAFFYAKQQVALYWPFRELNGQQFNNDMRAALSRKAHALGAIVACLVGAAFGYFVYNLSLKALILLVCLFFTYRNVFNITYAVSIGQNWAYLGTTSKQDALLKDGKLTAIVGMLLSIVLFTLLIFLK